MERNTMATKVQKPGDEVGIESEQLRDEIVVDKHHAGTAMKLARALEESEETLDRIMIGEGVDGSRRITINAQWGTDGSEKPVPDPIHNQLTEWGYQHAGEETGDYDHTEPWGSHVYLK